MRIFWHAARGTVAGRDCHARSGVAAASAAAVLVLVLAAPVLAQDGPTRLSDATASPRSAAVGVAITFSVTYRNPEGTDPVWVRVRVAGAPRGLARMGGGTIKNGVRYAGSFVLPAGTWPVSFEADTGKFTTALAAGSVTIARATPSPTSTPRPTATPRPTPRPSATPRPTPQATASPRETPAPRATPTGVPAGSPAPSLRSTPSPTVTGGPDGAGPTYPPTTPLPGASATLDGGVASPVPTSSADPLTAGGVVDTGGSAGTGGDRGGAGPGGDGSSRGSGTEPFGATLASAWLPPLLGGADLSPFGRVLASAVTTAAGVTVVMSFALFGKRRRETEPTEPDEVLAADARRGADPAAGDLVPAPVVLDGDLAMPRWRRPSLLEARRADPARMPTTHVSLTFDHGFVAPVAGLERRRIRYRVVRLLDGPDELLASEIGFLDEGDEVQLAERTGSFWKVLCPDGRSGWVHRMVLGEIVGPGGDDAGVDEDVLRAFRSSRAAAS